MKIAVLADIHSNVYALDAVIADGQRRGVDSMVNLDSVPTTRSPVYSAALRLGSCYAGTPIFPKQSP